VTAAPVAVIRAAALRDNLRRVRETVPGCSVLAVVKADAYGHGLVPVARILADADGFAVARIEEAVQLRDAGIARRVLVLGGFVDAREASECARSGFDCVIHSEEQVAVLESLRTLPPMGLWIKIDTGMGRLGIEPEALPRIRERLAASGAGCGRLRLMSHLAAADEPGGPGAEQLAAFAQLAAGAHHGVSIANSACILREPAACTVPGVPAAETWLRPGLMLYGVSPLPERSSHSLGLRPAMSFETRLIAVRRLPRGRRVGYGGEWQAARESVVGVAAVGYADGYPWHCATRTPVLVNGHPASVIGRISMDLISIDLTDAPPSRPGDRVILWGEELPVEEVARCAGTISYELLAGVSPRVVRRVED
jgi:alanine racemase